jgi:hypothetical protein
MAIISKGFDSYSIKYSSRKGQSTNLYAAITLYNGINHNTAGFIWFTDFSVQDDNSYKNNKIHLNFDISRFNNIVTILRYEKPLKIYLNDNSKKEGWIQTSVQASGIEPVGEQEP